MAIKTWEAPTQPFKTTLDGRLTSGDTSMALVATTGLQAPGIILVDRQDGQGTDTPENMEYISYTGVLTKSLTGLTRALGGTTAKDHGSGSIVECFLTAKHWGDLVDYVDADHDTLGKTDVSSHLRSIQVTGVSGASGIVGDAIFVPFNNITITPLAGSSGYGNILFDGPNMGRTFGGLTTGTSSGGYKTGIHLIEHNETIKSFSFVLTAPTSEASLTIDMLKNNASIFGTLKPIISQGGTYVSTASIANKTLIAGNYIHLTFS